MVFEKKESICVTFWSLTTQKEDDRCSQENGVSQKRLLPQMASSKTANHLSNAANEAFSYLKEPFAYIDTSPLKCEMRELNRRADIGAGLRKDWETFSSYCFNDGSMSQPRGQRRSRVTYYEEIIERICDKFDLPQPELTSQTRCSGLQMSEASFVMSLWPVATAVLTSPAGSASRHHGGKPSGKK
jgi:hypothetical protein